MVKSERVTQSLHSTAVPVAQTAARLEVENRLGASAASVRRDPEPVLQEALTLRR
jgi:hypothetical protein